MVMWPWPYCIDKSLLGDIHPYIDSYLHSSLYKVMQPTIDAAACVIDDALFLQGQINLMPAPNGDTPV